MLFVHLKGIKGMCLSKNKGDKLLKVSLTKGTVYYYLQNNNSVISLLLFKVKGYLYTAALYIPTKRRKSCKVL